MKDRSNSIQVIERAARLLDGIASNGEIVSLKVLSAETGLHPSTAFRILGSLTAQGFVERTDNGCYRLGIKLLQLGSLVRTGLDVRRVAQPIMELLRDQVGETVNLTVREGEEVVYVERVAPKRMIRVEQVVGSRAPLHVTAVGKLMLADLGETAIAEYVSRTGLPAYTPNTLTDVAVLRDAVARDQARGYAFDNEEAELGVGCIGALVRDSQGSVVAGLSVSAPIERRRDEWAALVLDAARQISQRLGFVAPDLRAVRVASA